MKGSIPRVPLMDPFKGYYKGTIRDLRMSGHLRAELCLSRPSAPARVRAAYNTGQKRDPLSRGTTAQRVQVSSWYILIGYLGGSKYIP